MRCTIKTLAVVLMLAVGSTAVVALRGVIEQSISYKDDISNYYSQTVALKKDPSPVWGKGRSDTFEAPSQLGRENVLFDGEAQFWGLGYLSIKCLEDLDDGNFNNGEGMQTTAMKTKPPYALIAKAQPELTLVLTDSMGSCEVEVRQKTFHRVKMKFDRNDADDQDKVFNFDIISVDVSGSTNRTSLNWSGSTTKSSTAGGSLAVGVNGKGVSAQASGSWSQTVAQTVDSIEIVAEADYDRRKSVTLGPGTLSHQFAISLTMEPSASIKDNNSIGFPDCSVLFGYGDYATVICIGKITLKANHDKSRADTVKFNGANPGDPRYKDDVSPDNAQNQPIIPKQP